MPPDPPVQARRFLHCCYCCTDVSASTAFLQEALDLELRMRSAGERVDGRQMGFPGEVETDACFVYDRRGPRVSPAIEVQQWIDPPTVGTPYRSPAHVGLQALGVAVPDLDGGLARLASLGATALGPARTVSTLGRVATLRDPTGVLLDLVEERGRAGSRLAHVRATCTDLSRSVAWYSALGFEASGAAQQVSLGPGALGADGEASVATVVLRLPDEPFALVLLEWRSPRAHGTPYETGNHAGLYRFALAVDDTRRAYEALRERWDLSSPPQRVELPGTTVPDMWIAFLTDPDGLVVELVERPRSAFHSAGMVT